MAVPSQRKRRARRRKEDKAPLSTRLVLPDHAKGDVGAMSDDLFRNLFPHSTTGGFSQEDAPSYLCHARFVGSD